MFDFFSQTRLKERNSHLEGGNVFESQSFK